MHPITDIRNMGRGVGFRYLTYSKARTKKQAVLWGSAFDTTRGGFVFALRIGFDLCVRHSRRLSSCFS
jgi:hypothetical protein